MDVLPPGIRGNRPARGMTFHSSISFAFLFPLHWEWEWECQHLGGGECKQMQVRRSLESKPVVKEGILCAHVSIVNYRVLPSEDNLVPQHHLANSLWQ